MTAAYSLTGLGQRAPKVSIDEKRYRAITDAHEGLLERLQIEEIYDIVVLNHLDFEKALLAVALDDMAGRGNDISAMEMDRRQANRAIANLLATGHLFIEVLKGSFTRLFGRDSNELTAIEAAVKAQEATRFGFRAMCCVRHYSQHRGLPVHGAEYSDEWTGSPQELDSTLQHRFSVSISPKTVAKDTRFDRDVLKELEARADTRGRVVLLPLLREYVEALSHLNEAARAVSKESEELWISTIADALAEAVAAAGDHPSALTIAEEREPGGKRVGYVALGLGLGERLRSLQKANRLLRNLHRRRIVS